MSRARRRHDRTDTRARRLHSGVSRPIERSRDHPVERERTSQATRKRRGTSSGRLPGRRHRPDAPRRVRSPECPDRSNEWGVGLRITRSAARLPLLEPPTAARRPSSEPRGITLICDQPQATAMVEAGEIFLAVLATVATRGNAARHDRKSRPVERGTMPARPSRLSDTVAISASRPCRFSAIVSTTGPAARDE